MPESSISEAMQPDEYWSALESASMSLRRCQCGSKVIMRAEPGVTFISCIKERKTVAAASDWCPAALSNQWNEQSPP